MNPELNTFQQRLAFALTQAGSSKTNLALILGVAPASITAWCKGQIPSTENLIKISTRLNISLCWLINGYGPINLYGPLHITPEEESLLLQLRFFPDEIFEHLFNFLASSTHAHSDAQLINRARAIKSLSRAKLAMAVIDTQGFIKDVSDEYLSLLGLKTEDKQFVINSYFIDWVSNESKAETILNIKAALKGPQQTHSNNFICELVKYQSNKTQRVALSGVLHGGSNNGFFLIAAFPLD